MRRTSAGLVVSILFRVAVCTVVLGIAVGIFLALVATRPVLEGVPNPDAGQRVVVFEPRPVSVRRQWSGYGTVEPIDNAAVPARVAAVVVERPARMRAGAAVKAGELIVRLDDTDFRRQAEIASSTLGEVDAQLARLEIEKAAWTDRVRLAAEDAEFARLDFERVRAAAAREAAKAREVEVAQQRQTAAERQAVAAREELDKIPARRLGLEALREVQIAQRALAELSIERCVVSSPIDGVLASVDVERGESVAPGQQVARVVSLARVEVPLRLPASARTSIAVGDVVTLFQEGRALRSGARSWGATVARIAPDDDPSTRTVTVFAEVSQDGDERDLLAPGRFVEGVVASSTSEMRFVVPRRSIRSDRLFVVADDRLARREVVPEFTLRATFPELGLPDSEWVVLRDPLSPDELVVLDGSRSLSEGTKADGVRHDAIERAVERAADAAPGTVNGVGLGRGSTAAPAQGPSR